MDVGRILPGRVNRAAGVPRARVGSIVRGQMLGRVSPVMWELTKTHLVPKHARRVRQHAQPMRFSYAVGTMREPVNRVRVASILFPTSVNRVVVAPQANTESAARGQMLDCAKLVYLGRIKPLRGRRLVCPVTNVTSTN